MPMNLSRALPSPLLQLVGMVGLALFGACSDSSPTSSTDDDDGGTTGAGGGSLQSGSPSCDDFIACAATAAPADLADIVSSYGMNGVCWTELDFATCDKACSDSLLMLEDADLCGSGTGGAGGDTGSGGDDTGAINAACVGPCQELYQCGIDNSRLCPGMATQSESNFVDGCASNPLCEASSSLIDPSNCAGTITTIKSLSADFSNMCEGT